MKTPHHHTQPTTKPAEVSAFVRFIHKLSHAGSRAIPYPEYGHTIVK